MLLKQLLLYSVTCSRGRPHGKKKIIKSMMISSNYIVAMYNISEGQLYVYNVLCMWGDSLITILYSFSRYFYVIENNNFFTGFKLLQRTRTFLNNTCFL